MFKDILVPVDLDDEGTSRKALDVAVRLARAFGARLHVMTVVPEFGMPAIAQYFPRDYETKMREKAHDRLQEMMGREIPDDVPRQLVVAEGTVYREILGAIGRLRCDLVVMGSHRPELKDYLLGPNAARVVRHAPCSVMVVRE